MWNIDKKNNWIHKTVIMPKQLSIGKNNLIGPYCVIGNNVTIGNDNKFHSHVSIGSPAEHIAPQFDWKKCCQKGDVIIGNRNTFREFITINKPIKENSLTFIEDDCYFTRGCHISHDTWIESKVVMACDVILGGHSRIMKGAFMGIRSSTHQYSIIGAYCIIGMGAVVVQDFGPGLKIVGVPARDIGMNEVGLKRANLNVHELDMEASRFAEAVARRDK